MSFVAFDCACAVVNIKSRRKAFNKRLLLSAAAITLVASPAAYANPLGGAVTTGSASISTSSNKTNVNQKSEDVVIDWSSFNIGSGQTTQFVQPNAQAIAVNRVGGANASQILGTLDANGRVVLINGNGVLFGKGAQVNVGSLIATTTDGSDSDVLSGKFTQAGKQNASVTNNGAITAASGGIVALVAPNVTNTGTVNAKLGTVALGAANKFTVDFAGDGLVSFAAQGDVNARASAINSGLLSGANVSMTAHAANGIATGIVNMSGIIQAQGVQNVGGTIYLNAGNGTLTTTGTLNAAGATGGGQVETSGHVANISGHITAGQGGRWKVDPEDLTIDSTAATTIDGALNGGTSVLEQTTSGAANGSGNQTSGAGDINVESALSWNSTATLTLDAYHSLNILAPITITGAGGLVLQYNDAATDGVLAFSANSGGTGLAAFTDVVGSVTQGNLTINGNAYTLANSVSQLASDISSNVSGFYALANSYNASGDGVYSQSPIETALTGTLEALGNTISNLTVNNPTLTDHVGLFRNIGFNGVVRDINLADEGVTGSADGYVGGLAGVNSGTILNAYAGGTMTGGLGEQVGGLVGFNEGTILNSHADGVAIGGDSSNVGGLVGNNQLNIVTSYAIGAATGGNSSYVGGLVGINQGTIENAYAGDTTTGGTSAYVGGLLGSNFATVGSSYATGTVSGGAGADVGGLIGEDNGGVSNSYWDMNTSGITNTAQGAGSPGNDPGITGETTAWLQGALPTGFSPGIWGTGAGLYPYLLSQFPSGTPQAVSGIAYGAGGGTVLKGGMVVALLDGAAFDPVPTGANGYYYLLVAPGTISAGNTAVLAYSSAEGTRVDTATDALDANNNISGFDIWGDTLIAPTSATAYSAASATSLQTQDASLIAQAIGANTDPTSGLTNYGYIATGSGFTIDEPLTLTNGLYVKTTASNSDIVVGDALTLPGSVALAFDSNHSIDFDAPVTVSGAGGVTLTTNDGGTGGTVGFDLGPTGFAGSLSYGASDNGGTLSINGASYTLLYSMSDVQNVNNGLTGTYALADSLDASAYSGWIPLGTNGSGTIENGGNGFTGIFEGLGNTISNLTVDLPAVNEVGLFGVVGGTLSDLGVIGGTVTGDKIVGGLVGLNADGVVANSYTTGTVDGFGQIGGLIGAGTGGTIFDSHATGPVSASGGSFVGGLVGNNGSAVIESYATGTVDAEGTGQGAGGLVGGNSGTIDESYATGAVSAGGTFTSAGGLVGLNSATIENSYATGAVDGTQRVGGLVGGGSGTTATISDSYATGAVSGSGDVGGLIGYDAETSGHITFSYWDTGTSGITSLSQGAGNVANDFGIAGETTAALQGTLPGGFDNTIWSTGTGLYPYLSWQFANGTPQAISGIAYTDAGLTADAGDTVSALMNGNALASTLTGGAVTTGANGYYYYLLAPGTLSGSQVLTTTPYGAALAQNASGSVSGMNIYGNTLNNVTSAALYSTAQNGEAANLATAEGSNSAVQSFVSGLANYQVTSSASIFTVDEAIDLSGTNVEVADPAGNITVSAAQSWSNANTLTLNAGGALTIDAPINVNGAGGVVLDAGYDTTTVPGTPLLELSFGLGPTGFAGNLNYAVGSGEGISGQSLTINGTPYTLLYSMTDVENIGNLAGDYALADSLNASGFNFTPIGNGEDFTGGFEGLGQTISNLSFTGLNPPYHGLFGDSSGTIRDIGMVGGVMGGSNGYIGFLAGIDSGTIENTFETGQVEANDTDPTQASGGLVGQATGTAVIVNSFATGSVGNNGATNVGGLVGDLQGTLVDDYSTASVSTHDGSQIGGLVGVAESGSTIENSYATGGVSATGTLSDRIGGLVGYLDGGTISGSFATGAVSGTNFVGGLLGESEEGAISNSYAMGSVNGSAGVGGLVGALFDPSSSVTDSFSIGRVTGSSIANGLVGEQSDSGGVSDSYWDTQTSGQSSGGTGAAPLTTSQMQGTFANMPGFTGPTWATSAGLFPYLSWQFNGTPQAISGVAYSNGGGTVLQSGTVSALVGGNALGTASTGANGYYYLLVAPGTIPGSNAVLAYSSANGARVDTATDALDANNNVSFFDIWGNTLIAPTSDAAYSTASATSLQTQDASLIAQAVGSNTNPATGLTNYGYIATGSGFTIDQPLTLSNGLYIKTTSGNIAVNDALTLPGSEGLALDSFGALTIDAPISITGAGALTLDYSTSAPTNLSFGLTSSGFTGRVNYGATDNGGTLTINGTPYTLVYSMSDVQNINASDAALVGNYALADSLDATGTIGWVPIGTESNSFGGTFEGLGNTISNLTVDLPSVSGVGLFGYATGSVFRDLGLFGGSTTGADLVGGLVGDNIQGTIANAYATGSVSGDSEVGGLVGNLDFLATITNAYATGAVSGSQDVGGLVGRSNIGTITNAYATGTVDDIGSGLSQYFGGLVGLVDDGGGITDAYATGAVTGSGSGVSEYGGGLVGRNDGAIIDAYATGSVSGFRVVGGLVGANDGGILDAYATGSVSGNAGVGGLVGGSATGAVLTDGYWDTQTSGQPSDAGGAMPLTTAQMQGTFANMPGFAGPTWATSAGLFPYLSWQFPIGTPQAISGVAYSNGGGTVLQSGTVSALVGGAALGTASTGANGYYYLLVAPGTIPAGNDAVLAYSSANGARVDTATDALDANNNVSFFDIWGNTLIAPTSDTTYSAASATSLQTQDASLIAQAIGTNANPTTGLTNYGYIATGSGFTIDQPLTLSNGLYVKTTSGNIVVDDALTLPGSEGLALESSGALTIDAPISVTGAGAVILDAGTDTTTVPGNAVLELSFGSGDNIAFAVGSGEGVSGQSLAINGAAYTLVYSAADLQNVNNNLNGDYALANALDASSVGSWVPLGTSGGSVQNFGNGFNGIFEGLGNTISNFSLDLPGATYVGLFGYAGSASTIRDLTLAGGSVTGTASAYVGALAGYDDGIVDNVQSSLAATGAGGEVGGLVGYMGTASAEIANSSSSGTVTATDDADAGGLVGDLEGTVVSSYATGPVSAGASADIGGLVGYALGEIENSHAAGNVTATDGGNIGGLVGFADEEVENSYATGNVVATTDADAGGLSGYSNGSIVGSYATGTVSVGSEADVGGLTGYANEAVENSYATGAVTGGAGSYAGGLTGYNWGAISNSHATGLASADTGSDVGGLTGYSYGGVAQSYATGGASGGPLSYVGGLAGFNGGGAITQSFAAGPVAGGGASEVGGLAGENDTSIAESYAMASVGGTSADAVGGLVGVNALGATIAQTYATGYVVPGSGSNVGGLVGTDNASAGSITYSYWDMQTSGTGATHGAGNITSDSGITGETTSGLQGTLPGGFSNTVWSTGTGLYPYLSWQFSGTPQAISGTVYSGSTALAGENVGLLVNGSEVAPAITAGSGADGYYYLLLAPGTISGSGSDVVTYLTSGTPANTFVQDATGTLAGVELLENTFVAASHASDSAAILAELPTALGSASGSQFLYTAASGVVPGVNLAIYDSAPAFTLDSSLDVGNAILDLYTTGSDTQTAGTVTVHELVSTSTGGFSLGDSNAIAYLGNIGNSGAGGISVTDNQALTVDGYLSTGTDAITLTTTGAGNGIAIDDHLVGGTVDLVSAGTIRENGTNGFIHANVLEGSSDGLAFFNEANKIGALGDFTTGAAGAFSLYDWETLDVTGAVTAGKHSITLDTQIGDLDIDGSLTSGGTVSLASVAGQVTGTGAIDAKLLNVRADTGIDLDGSDNDIQSVGTDTTNSGPNVINR